MLVATVSAADQLLRSNKKKVLLFAGLMMGPKMTDGELGVTLTVKEAVALPREMEVAHAKSLQIAAKNAPVLNQDGLASNLRHIRRLNEVEVLRIEFEDATILCTS